MKETCEYMDRLHMLKDGELSDRDKSIMMNHLRTCEACQDEWNSISHLSRMMAGLEDQEPGPDFDRTFWAKVADYENNRLTNRLKRLFASPWQRVLVPVLATLILAVVISLNVYRSGPVQPDISLSDEMDLLNDFDVVNNLDLLENWDEINRVELKS